MEQFDRQPEISCIRYSRKDRKDNMEEQVLMDMETSRNRDVESSHPAAQEAPSRSIEPIFCDTIDIDSYSARYRGYMRIQRLLFIASRCPNLQVDAARAALDLIKKTLDTALYLKTAAEYMHLLPEFHLDSAWVEDADRQFAQNLERIESEINTAKSRMSKESIRMGYNELGELHYSRGDLAAALKAYVRTREGYTMAKHTADMCLNVIKVTTDMGHWRHVSNYISKQTEATPEFAAKIKAAAGIVAIEEGQYKQAARRLLSIDMDFGSSFAEVIAPEDIAIYGTVCALATLDRQELRKKLFENAAFKNLLDLVPNVREMANDFFNGRYGSCLQRLNQLQPEIQLDLHLTKHATKLMTKIRESLIVQYFFPYLSVDLHRMATAFNFSVNEMEQAVATLIANGQLPARIDSQSKTLHRRQRDDRHISLEKVLRLSQVHARETHTALLRLSLLEHDFFITTGGERRAASPDEELDLYAEENQQDSLA